MSPAGSQGVATRLGKSRASDSDEGEDWGNQSFLRLAGDLCRVGQGCIELDSVEGTQAVARTGAGEQIDSEALRLFRELNPGVRPFAPFHFVVDAWQHGRPNVINRVDGRAGGTSPCQSH